MNDSASSDIFIFPVTARYAIIPYAAFAVRVQHNAVAGIDAYMTDFLNAFFIFTAWSSEEQQITDFPVAPAHISAFFHLVASYSWQCNADF